LADFKGFLRIMNMAYYGSQDVLFNKTNEERK